MAKAIFPGSFDPFTNGHFNILSRARAIFDEVDVVVSYNSGKSCLFTLEERVGFIADLIKVFPNVTVHTHSGLVVEYAKTVGARVLIRGIRNSVDFNYEFDLSLMNHNLCDSVETIFIPTDQRYLLLKSSAIKELASLGGDVSGMVSEKVFAALKQKFNKE